MKRYAVFGAGNIGFGVAERLTSDAEVYVFDIKKPTYLSDLMNRCERISFVQVDATNEDEVEAAVRSSLQRESLDGAILTVGVSSASDAFESLDAFRRTVNINFLGNIVPMRVLVRNGVFRSPAKITVVASTSGHFAGVSLNAYAPSKWMLVNACDSVRAELEERGIALDMINPRTIRNVRSDVFKSTSGIEVSTVVDAILKHFGGGERSRDCFIPKRYGAFHAIERLSPWLFDAAVHLPPRAIRKRGYKRVKGSALITGASSGLGRELTRLYADRCDRIYVTARNRDALEKLRDELAGKCEIIPIQVDFENVDAVDAVKGAIEDREIKLLINNAGHHVKGSLLEVPVKTIEKTMMVNFFNPIALMAAFPNASIVANVLSTTAIHGRRNLGVYSSTKAGLWCFSKALRRTHGRTMNVVDIIPATFKSSLATKGDKVAVTERVESTRFSSAKDGLKAAGVAEIIQKGIDKKRDAIYIPGFKVRLFLALEAVAPGVFRRLFQ